MDRDGGWQSIAILSSSELVGTGVFSPFFPTCSRKKVVQHCVGNAGSPAAQRPSGLAVAVWFSEWMPGEDGAWLSQGSLQETWQWKGLKKCGKA